MADPYVPYRREIRPPYDQSLGEHVDRQLMQIEKSLATLDQRAVEGEEFASDTTGELAAINAAVTTEITERQDADSAIAAEVTTLTSRMDSAETSITNEQIARSTTDSALAADITTLQANFGSVSSIVNSKDFASSVANEALAGSLLMIASKLSEAQATITIERTSRVTSEEAQARTLESLDVRLGSAEASITTEQTARATADSALSSQITDLTATVGSNTAAISSETTARVNGDSALSSSITSLTSTVNGNTASISTQSSAISTLQGRTAAFWQVDAVAGGRAQLKVYADANGGGGVDIIGDVKINGNLLVSGSVTASQIASSTVNTGNLADNAATVPVTAYTAGSVNVDKHGSGPSYRIDSTQSYVDLQSATITTTGKPVLILCSLRANAPSQNGGLYEYRILRDGAEVYAPARSSVSDVFFDEAAQGLVTFTTLDTPSSGSHTYVLQCRASGGCYAERRSITLIEFKK